MPMSGQEGPRGFRTFNEIDCRAYELRLLGLRSNPCQPLRSQSSGFFESGEPADFVILQGLRSSSLAVQLHFSGHKLGRLHDRAPASFY